MIAPERASSGGDANEGRDAVVHYASPRHCLDQERTALLDRSGVDAAINVAQRDLFRPLRAGLDSDLPCDILRLHSVALDNEIPEVGRGDSTAGA